MDDKVKPLVRPKKACAICGKPVVEAHSPFCSTRCQQVDLSRWLKGSYAIPVVEDDTNPSPRDDDSED